MLHFGVVTLMPEMFHALAFGVVGRALKEGLAQMDCFNPRDWASLPHRQVDDKPYGGGPGMVMMYAPLVGAIQHAKAQLKAPCKTVYLSPQGRPVNQAMLNEIAKNRQPLLFIAGRYEGIDERVIQHHVDEEWSLGDFVLSGGELAAMAFMDAIIRLLPGSLGHAESAQQDSFMDGLLDYPHYTRPAEIHGMNVPSVLLDGNHKEIDQWRRKQALGNTWLKKPDMLKNVVLSSVDQTLLQEFIQETQANEQNNTR